MYYVVTEHVGSTHKGWNGEERERNSGLHPVDAGNVFDALRDILITPFVCQVTEADEPQERPETCRKKQ